MYRILFGLKAIENEGFDLTNGQIWGGEEHKKMFDMVSAL